MPDCSACFSAFPLQTSSGQRVAVESLITLTFCQAISLIHTSALYDVNHYIPAVRFPVLHRIGF